MLELLLKDVQFWKQQVRRHGGRGKNGTLELLQKFHSSGRRMFVYMWLLVNLVN